MEATVLASEQDYSVFLAIAGSTEGDLDIPILKEAKAEYAKLQ